MSDSTPVTIPPVALSLTVQDASAALHFYNKAFAARELYRFEVAGKGVLHAEFAVRGTKLYISDEAPDFQAFAMPRGTMASCLICLESDDCDGDYKRAMEAGARSITQPENQFHGVRNAVVLDPFGYRWCFNQVVEALTDDEIAQRAKERFGL
ncbi:MAG: VOC family protein [Opitutales bacterium]